MYSVPHPKSISRACSLASATASRTYGATFHQALPRLLKPVASYTCIVACIFLASTLNCKCISIHKFKLTFCHVASMGKCTRMDFEEIESAELKIRKVSL